MGDWLAARGAETVVHRLARGTPPPAPASYDALVVLGGPMGVYQADRHPWLEVELDAIRAALDAGRPVLGLCLGSQLLAAAFGGRVYRSGRQEIGWFSVRRAVGADASPFGAMLPASLLAFHWHGDTFELPSGATRLFESDAFPEQGFSVGARVLALQFHPEITPAMVVEWSVVGVDDLAPAPSVQDAAALRAGVDHCAAGHALLDALLPRLL